MQSNSDTTIEEAEFDSSVETESVLLSGVHPSESILIKDEAGGGELSCRSRGKWLYQGRGRAGHFKESIRGGDY